MLQAEQKAKWSPAAGSVDVRSMQLQQDLVLTQQQLQDEEAKLQQLTQTVSSFRQKAELLSNPAQAASMQARQDCY